LFLKSSPKIRANKKGVNKGYITGKGKELKITNKKEVDDDDNDDDDDDGNDDDDGDGYDGEKKKQIDTDVH